jgi:hypothetical protein
MKFNAVLILSLSALSLAACNKSVNPRMQTPIVVNKPVTVDAGETKVIAEPKVNILFVVDNSGSMKAHQETLKANIDVFANKFFNNPRIDYKIGIVPVYDRRYLNDKKVYPVVGVRKMNPFGELVSLKDKDGQPIQAAPFITRDTPDAKNVLKSTVALGVQWGPEAEESFSPVIEVISNNELNQSKNAGFYDKDAYLVVIFLTDADDATPQMTASEFYDDLLAAKGGDATKILIAAALPSAKVNSVGCSLDGNGPQYQFPELVNLSGALVADLCSNTFGQKLAAFGDKLVQRVATQRIKIGFKPEDNMKVTYGTAETPENQRQQILESKNGYSFDPEHDEIMISPNLDVKRVPGGKIFVTATPINARTAKATQQTLSKASAANKPK